MLRCKHDGLDRLSQTGFTYLGLLILLLIFAMTGSLLASLGAAHKKRDRETQLLFVGKEFSRAFASYALASRTDQIPFPQNIGELLADRRNGTTVRHLRKYYYDPLTNKQDWIFVTGLANRIVAIHSSSHDAPIKKADFLQTFGT